MPLITFSSPSYKDKTLYAVAGSFTETVLKIAKTNRIPIAFGCGDGKCGSCVIRVKYLEDKTPMGMHMEDKERHRLRQMGKLDEDREEMLTTRNQPSEWRLACQFIPRDEDILVEYQAR